MFWNITTFLDHVAYTLFHVHITLFQLSNCVQGVVVVQNDTQQSGCDPSLSAPIIRHEKIISPLTLHPGNNGTSISRTTPKYMVIGPNWN